VRRRCSGASGGQPHAVVLADAPEHLVEGVVGDGGDQHLRLDATEEGLVAERLGLEVGREHDLDVEGDVELHAVVELQVVALAIEGDDPPVQQRLGGQVGLAPEVVDDEDPVVGLHLHRSHVGAALALVLEVEHLRPQLAADDEARPVAEHPTPVDSVGLLLEGPVHHGVEDVDDLAVDLDGVGDEDVVAVDAQEPLGDRRLAGAGRPVQEHGAAGDGGGPQLAEQLITDDQVGEGGLERVEVHPGAGVLPADHLGVRRQAHRHRPDVARELHAVVGLLAAAGGRSQPVVAPVDALDLEELEVAQVLDHLGHQRRPEGEAAAELGRRGPAHGHGLAQHDVVHQRLGHAQVLDRPRCRDVDACRWSPLHLVLRSLDRRSRGLMIGR
jgi:hypothetical protein